jgi:16S rRNA processing protein RimM
VPGWFTLARIARPRGTHGEMAADGPVDDPERLLRFPRVFVFPPGGQVRVESVWVHDGRLVVKLEGVDSIGDAERFRNAEIRIPKEDRPPPPNGEYYLEDLEGCRVVRAGSGEELGVVTGWMDCGGPVVLEVERSGKEPLLVPLAKAICKEVDVEAQRIVADLPEGLEEL